MGWWKDGLLIEFDNLCWQVLESVTEDPSMEYEFPYEPSSVLKEL